MDPDFGRVNRVCWLFEVDQGSLRMQMTAKLIGKHDCGLIVNADLK